MPLVFRASVVHAVLSVPELGAICLQLVLVAFGNDYSGVSSAKYFGTMLHTSSAIVGFWAIPSAGSIYTSQHLALPDQISTQLEPATFTHIRVYVHIIGIFEFMYTSSKYINLYSD